MQLCLAYQSKRPKRRNVAKSTSSIVFDLWKTKQNCHRKTWLSDLWCLTLSDARNGSLNIASGSPACFAPNTWRGSSPTGAPGIAFCRVRVPTWCRWAAGWRLIWPCWAPKNTQAAPQDLSPADRHLRYSKTETPSKRIPQLFVARNTQLQKTAKPFTFWSSQNIHSSEDLYATAGPKRCTKIQASCQERRALRPAEST